MNVNGAVKFAIEGTVTSADMHTENATITASTDTLVEVELSTYEITKLVQISASVKTMTIPAFEAWLVLQLAEAIAMKIEALAVSYTHLDVYKRQQQGSTKKRNKSVLYETMVIPYIQNHNVKTILDFGCGKGAYINMLSKKYDAIGVEFYNNNGKDIIVSKGNNMIDKLIAYLNTNKTFDIVVCDSVLNSVDSVKAEKSVMACLNLFTKDIAFISGRPNKYDAVQNLSLIHI